jgi:hypothetical protein
MRVLRLEEPREAPPTVSRPLSSPQISDSDDLCPAAPAEPARALESLGRELAHLLLDLGIVRVIGGIGEKPRGLLVIPGREVVARFEDEALDVVLVGYAYL